MRNNKYNLTIHEYCEENSDEWDNFIASSNNGTIFHLQKFLKYHNTGKFEFTHYIIRNDAQIVAVLPGGFKENGSIYWSPIGASYGSFVTADLPFEISLAIVDEVINFFKLKRTKEIFLIPPPLIYSKIYNQHLEYAMLYRKFDFEYHYISHSLDLSIDYKNCYNRATKFKFNKIKKADLSIIQKNNFEDFYPILLENKRKHNAIPTHSLEDLIKLNTLLPDRLKLFIAYHEDIPIAGFLIFLTNQNVSLCFYNAMDYDYKKLFPAYALTEYVIDWSKENGYKWFDFGVSQDTVSDNPMAPSLDLIYFKEFFNTRGIFRSTYHLRLND
jgi:hypothetical protein